MTEENMETSQTTIYKTMDFDKFIFLEENRCKISESHVEKIQWRILKKNLLHIKPILVTKKFEIIDGQHRALAAKGLATPIYYQIVDDIDDDDIITLNISKCWQVSDLINFWCKKGLPDYIMLREFIRQSKVEAQLAYRMCCKDYSKKAMEKLRSGEFKYISGFTTQHIEDCKDIIACFKKNARVKTNATGVNSKLWKALLRLVTNPKADIDKLIRNMVLSPSKVSLKASYEEYVTMFESIHNYHTKNEAFRIRL